MHYRRMASPLSTFVESGVVWRICSYAYIHLHFQKKGGKYRFVNLIVGFIEFFGDFTPSVGSAAISGLPKLKKGEFFVIKNRKKT